MKRLVKVNIGGRGMMSPQEQTWRRGMAESQRGTMGVWPEIMQDEIMGGEVWTSIARGNHEEKVYGLVSQHETMGEGCGQVSQGCS